MSIIAAHLRRFAGVALLALCALPARGVTISYGNFGPVAPGVTFVDVEETVPGFIPVLLGPTAFPVGLDFAPIGFVAYSSGVGSNSNGSTIAFTLNAQSGLGIAGLSSFESGDFSIAGTGTPVTTVSAAVQIRASVTAINGTPVAPIVLAPVNASVAYGLPAFAGVVQPWSMLTSINIQSQLLGLGHGLNDVATSLDIEIDNLLTSTTEASTAASLAKKDFRVDVQVTNVIPEPSSLALGAVAAVVMFRRRRHV